MKSELLYYMEACPVFYCIGSRCFMAYGSSVQQPCIYEKRVYSKVYSQTIYVS